MFSFLFSFLDFDLLTERYSLFQRVKSDYLFWFLGRFWPPLLNIDFSRNEWNMNAPRVSAVSIERCFSRWHYVVRNVFLSFKPNSGSKEIVIFFPNETEKQWPKNQSVIILQSSVLLAYFCIILKQKNKGCCILLALLLNTLWLNRKMKV